MHSLAHDLFSLKAAPNVEELNRRYRSICKNYHPDLREEAERAFGERCMQAVNSAYQDALARFSIFRRSSPEGRTAVEAVSVRTGVGETQPRAPETGNGTRAEHQRSSGAGARVAAARLLGAALATLKRTRCFYSLSATDDEQERERLVEGIAELQLVIERQQGSREAQDALFYQAMALCNLREYGLALRLFRQYARAYPADTREGAFHFYCGLLQHRMGHLDLAIEEYGLFLTGGAEGQYRHFLALVASFLEAAKQGATPHSLPYG